MSDNGWQTIKLGPGEHEGSSIKHPAVKWDAGWKRIVIQSGRKVRIEGAGKGKTVLKCGVWIKEGTEGELVGLTIADSEPAASPQRNKK